jgi:hypothetical protein
VKSIKTSLLFASVLLTAGAAFAQSGPPPNQMVAVPANQYDVDRPDPYGDPTQVFHNRSTRVYDRQVYKVPAKGFVLAVKEDGDVVTRREVLDKKLYIVEPQNVNAPFKYKEPK